jgi:pimeloyl-ACP methyl ester carboxylesterase
MAAASSRLGASSLRRMCETCTLAVLTLITSAAAISRLVGGAPARFLPDGRASWYEGVGHVPHLEEPDRFNSELMELTRRVRA